MRKISLALFLVSLLSNTVVATPKNVIITRHADKVLPHGFCLSLQGLERAAALAYYFSDTPHYNTPPISHIFAAYSGQPKPYIRCTQTCQPTATHLKLPLNTAFTLTEVKEVAHEILTNPLYDNTTVLMCWEHEHIASLVIALGGENPGFWPDNIFDQVYLLSYEENNKPKLQKFLQELMFGDRASFKDEPHPLPQVPVPCPKIAS